MNIVCRGFEGSARITERRKGLVNFVSLDDALHQEAGSITADKFALIRGEHQVETNEPRRRPQISWE
jgi:hypothetical protein